jgi:hypothetical protein
MMRGEEGRGRLTLVEDGEDARGRFGSVLFDLIESLPAIVQVHLLPHPYCCQSGKVS